jgi:hypothetical protein
MWAALAKYQPYADADGHGKSWRVMCSERTQKAARAAARAAADASASAAWDAAAWWAAAWAALAAEAYADADAEASAAYWADRAIKRIERAIKERNHD